MEFILLIIVVFLFTLSVGMVIESRTPERIIVEDKLNSTSIYDEGD